MMSTSFQVGHQAILPNAQPALFTLTFPGGQIAVLEVRGATDQEQAREAAYRAFPKCRYTVTDGDITNGHAQYFYLWYIPTREGQQEDHLARESMS